MNVENSQPVSMIRPEDLMEELNIKKDTYYRDINYLGIEAQRDSEGKLFLTPEQADQVRFLRSYVEQNGRRNGFENNSIVRTDGSSIESNSEQRRANGNGKNPAVEEQFEALIRSAQEYKASTEIAKYMLASQMTEEMLPSDLRDRVEVAKATAAPKSSNPLEMARKMVQTATGYMRNKSPNALEELQ